MILLKIIKNPWILLAALSVGLFFYGKYNLNRADKAEAKVAEVQVVAKATKETAVAVVKTQKTVQAATNKITKKVIEAAKQNPPAVKVQEGEEFDIDSQLRCLEAAANKGEIKCD